MGLFSSIASIAAPIIGGVIGNKGASDVSQQNAAYQKEFAQHGIRWKVADAKAAGLHPLAALNTNTATFSPSFQTGNMGQNISRAINAAGSALDRQKSAEADALALERASLQNDLLRAQISHVGRASNPPFPSGSVSGDHTSVDVPSEITYGRSRNRGETAGRNTPAATEILNRDGTTSIIPSEDVADALEAGGEIVGGIMSADWFARNRVAPWAHRQKRNARRAFKRVWWNPKNW